MSTQPREWDDVGVEHNPLSLSPLLVEGRDKQPALRQTQGYGIGST